MASDNKPDLSVVIVNYRTPEFTCKAIASVVKNSPTLIKEIIVVDNASGDNSVECIHNQWGEHVTLIENEENIGFAKANNQAMEIAKGRYYLLLNSDAEILEDAMERLVQYADLYPNVGITGCTILSSDGSQQASCWRPFTLSYLFVRSIGLFRVLPDGWFGSTNINTYGKPQNTKPVDVVSGCLMLVRRDAADKVGLFDERFFMYSEDTDWCTRMWKGGYEVHFLTDASVRHYGGGTSAQMFTTMRFELNRSVLLLFRKERGWGYAVVGNMLFLLNALVRIPYWFMKWVLRIDIEKSRSMLRANIYGTLLHLKWPFQDALKRHHEGI